MPESVLVSEVEVINDLGCRKKILENTELYCWLEYYGKRADCFDLLAKGDH